MKFSFRRSRRTPLGRVTLTHRGISHSVRTPLGTFSNRLLSFGGNSGGSDASAGSTLLGCLVGILALGLLPIILCCGLGALSSATSEPDQRLATRASKVEHNSNSLEQEDEGSSVAPSQDQELARAKVVGKQPEETLAREPPSETGSPSQTPEIRIVADSHPQPTLPQPQQRTWTDQTGSNSVVATLTNFNDTHVQLERADNGKRIALPIAKLSLDDQTHLIYATTKRLDSDAKILIGPLARVLDGDTVRIHDLETGEHNIRLLGIDAPETAQRFGS
ncbi:MAG: SHD1 domain-containing protein, partial [Planctomycetota bacterium]